MGSAIESYLRYIPRERRKDKAACAVGPHSFKADWDDMLVCAQNIPEVTDETSVGSGYLGSETG